MGCQSMGVPIGGAMDRGAAAAANALVGNPVERPVLEMTLVGPVLRFEGSGSIALVGADLSPQLNGKPMLMCERVTVATGDVLHFGRCVSGCRAYLAIGGKWDVPVWMGSVSPMCEGEAVPGKLTKGSVLSIETVEGAEFCRKVAPEPWVPVLGVYEGPECHLLNVQQKKAWTSVTHVVSSHSNRMGLRLKTKLILEEPMEVISSGVFPGVVQLTHSGQPIILGIDAQTTGGYPRIAVVQSEDLDVLAQLKPGDTFRFVWL
ncbi:hypothetical protein BFP72_11300 [Reichenbachiella sp. 5M10]|nr:hypothetical protein BFP72_11300 [Reichenbachiella sp. 5M10]